MKITFLEARVPLTKRFTASEKQPYPNAFEFTSHTKGISNLPQFTDELRRHAGLGHCLLKGEITKPLVSESRAGATDPLVPTSWLCLDIDGIASVATVNDFMARIGLSDISYVLQWSSSYGIHGNFTLRAHVFVFLSTAIAPELAKHWLKLMNLRHFKPDLSLTKTNMALKWGLDVTTCQNDKLIYITPPQCTPASLDQFTGKRIEYIQKTSELYFLDPAGIPTIVLLKKPEEDTINELRAAQGLPKKAENKFSLKYESGEGYLPNPDPVAVTGMKTERGFTYLNINGGDSWAYWHPEDNPEFIHNFKDEPVYKTKELAPSYWAQLQRAKRAAKSTAPGRLYLAFRDFRTSEYYCGWYDQATDTLDVSIAKNKTQLEDFLESHGQPKPGAIPDWNVVYDPHAPQIDITKRQVNFFQPSQYMRSASTTSMPAPTPLILSIISHVMGPAMVPYFLNWLAFCFVHRIAPQTAWIWHGTQGTGKGLLINYVITPLFGAQNVSVRRMEELEDKFNDHLDGRLICFIDEAQISDSKRSSMIMANLKNQITEPTISLRKMYQQARQVENRVGWIFASNMPDPIVVDPSDRRFFVGEYQPAPIVFTHQDMTVLEGELQDFADMLVQYKIDKAMVTTPLHNAAKSQMILMSQTSADVVAQAINAGQLAVLWDALPTIDTSMMDVSNVIRLQPYKMLVHELVKSRRNKLTRDELAIIFGYNVGDTPTTPHKFTSFVKHHGLTIKDIRVGTKVTKGVHVDWIEPDLWFEERVKEIEAESAPKLKLVAPKSKIPEAKESP